MFRLLGFMFILYFVAQPSFADDRSKVVGLWKLVSYEVEIQATGQKAPVMGQNPTGYASFLPEGRVFFILTGEARKPAKTFKIEDDRLQVLTPWRVMPNWADKGMTRSIVTFEREK